MIPFICGFVIGGMFGVTVVALCAVGGDSPSVPRVIVSDEETDCATGCYECGGCGGSINPYAAYCEHCGARLEDA